MRIAVKVNGQPVQASVEPRTHLADFLREQQRLTGTHLGCEHGVCGACTVLMDGVPVRSCITYAASCDGREIRTIEGFDGDPLMESLRAAFSREHALQCGFCTPGMLITARDICERLPGADEERIRVELSGNICRCTGYMGIVRAVKSVGGAAPWAAARAVETKPVPAAQPAKPAAVAAEAFDELKGWTRIEDRFSVPHSPEEVWKVIADLPAASACLPGAELLEHDERSAKASMRVRFGPMSAAFAGGLMFDRDDAAKRAVIRGSGTDRVSSSRVHGKVAYRVLPDGGRGGAHVEVVLDYRLTGPLSQFARSGLVKDLVGHMVVEFGRNLSTRIASPQARVRQAEELRAGSLFLSLLWRRIRALFRKA